MCDGVVELVSPVCVSAGEVVATGIEAVLRLLCEETATTLHTPEEHLPTAPPAAAPA